MDFLKDSRIAPFWKTTSVNKYFPKYHPDHSQKQNIINPVYLSLKAETNEKNSQAKLGRSKEKKQSHNSIRQSILIADEKFRKHKSSQRLSTINTMFNTKEIVQKGKKMDSLRSIQAKYLNFNCLSQYAEQFQKNIKHEKQKAVILSKWNNKVKGHYVKYEVCQEKSRRQIKDHDKIVDFLQAEYLASKPTVLTKSISIDRICELSSSAPCQQKVKNVMERYRRERYLKTAEEQRQKKREIQSAAAASESKRGRGRGRGRGQRSRKQYNYLNDSFKNSNSSSRFINSTYNSNLQSQAKKPKRNYVEQNKKIVNTYISPRTIWSSSCRNSSKNWDNINGKNYKNTKSQQQQQSFLQQSVSNSCNKQNNKLFLGRFGPGSGSGPKSKSLLKQSSFCMVNHNRQNLKEKQNVAQKENRKKVLNRSHFSNISSAVSSNTSALLQETMLMQSRYDNKNNAKSKK